MSGLSGRVKMDEGLIVSTVNEIRTHALALPLGERATLARDLLSSLEESTTDPNWAQDWAAEIEGRCQARDKGQVNSLDWREAVDQLRKALAERRKA